MLYKFFKVQWMNPNSWDWTFQVKNDMKDLGLDLSHEEIEEFSKHKFKMMIKEKVRDRTFSILLEEKEKHSKMKNLHYSKYQTQSYLTNKDIPKNDALNVLRFRTRMTKFAKNYGSLDVCPACRKHLDGQDEIENCEEMKKQFKNLHTLNNVYEEDVLPETAKLITEILNYREMFNSDEDGRL